MKKRVVLIGCGARIRDVIKHLKEDSHNSKGHGPIQIAGVCAVSVFHFSDNMTGEMFVDFPMSRDGLTNAGSGILIPVMSSSMPQENAAILFKLPDKIIAFHANCISATWRTPGIFPLVTSS